MQENTEQKTQQPQQQKPKFRPFYTMLIGLGFLTTTISWTLYNNYVPIFLQDYIPSKTIVGFIMTVDNIAAITLQPWIGGISDKTWTRFGRRMPFLIVGIPSAAFFFALLPMYRFFGGFVLLMIAIIGFDITMALYRAPTVALMPDLTPREYHSRANGIINLMGGIGAALATGVGAWAYGHGWWIPFVGASIIMVLCLVVMLLTIREPKIPISKEEEKKASIVEGFKEIFTSKDKSALFILIAIFSWFFAEQSLETWITSYGKFVMGIEEHVAAGMLTYLMAAFVLFAYPAGIVGEHFGRKRTIVVGLIITIGSAFLVPFFLSHLSLIPALFVAFGLGWALININSIAIVWGFGGKRTGVYTGLYYFFSSLAAITGPTITGAIFDVVGGFDPLFAIATGMLVVAFVCMLFVKEPEKGEVSVSEAISEAM